MELFTQIINETNDILWTYILVVMLLGCAVWFSIKTKFVQFRMIGEMIRLLGDSTAKINGHEKHISSFRLCSITGKPRRHRQPCRSGYGHHRGRSGRSVLDVDYSFAWFEQRVCRVVIGAVVQDKGQALVYRRTGLLYGEGTQETLDGHSLCGAYHHNVRLCV